jgi:hypothetical protein
MSTFSLRAGKSVPMPVVGERNVRAGVNGWKKGVRLNIARAQGRAGASDGQRALRALTEKECYTDRKSPRWKTKRNHTSGPLPSLSNHRRPNFLHETMSLSSRSWRTELIACSAAARVRLSAAWIQLSLRRPPGRQRPRRHPSHSRYRYGRSTSRGSVIA